MLCACIDASRSANDCICDKAAAICHRPMNNTLTPPADTSWSLFCPPFWCKWLVMCRDNHNHIVYFYKHCRNSVFHLVSQFIAILIFLRKKFKLELHKKVCHKRLARRVLNFFSSSGTIFNNEFHIFFHHLDMMRNA